MRPDTTIVTPDHNTLEQSAPIAHVDQWTRRKLLVAAALGLTGGIVGPLLTSENMTAMGASSPSGTLTVDLTADAESMDPFLVYETDGQSVMKSIFDNLVDRDPQGKMIPMLAQSYRWISPTLLEFQLRKGIKFHNGEPFDAAAAAFSVQRMLDPRTLSQVRSSYEVIAKAEVVGSHTLHLHLSQTSTSLLDALTQFLCIVPPRYIAEKGSTYFAAHPVGTGPFTFGEWVRDDHITLHANTSYWAGSPKGHPLVQTLTFRPVSDPLTRIADLKTGKADLIRALPPDLASLAQGGEPGVTTRDQVTTRFAIVFLNTMTAGPLRDKRVRQAMNYALDVPALIKALLGGYGFRLAAPATPATLGYDPHLAPYTYNVARAKALLAQAGYPKGFSTVMDYATSERAEIVQAVAGQLRAIGVQVTLQPRELTLFNAEWSAGKQAPLRYSTWGPMLEPWTALFWATSRGILSKYANPAADTLIFQALKTPDDTKRAALYRQLFRLLHDDAMGLFLFPLSDLYGVRSTLQWTPRVDDIVQLTGAHLG